MGWMAAIVREPAASRGSSTGRTRAGQMAAGTAHAWWGWAQQGLPACVFTVYVRVIMNKTAFSFHSARVKENMHNLRSQLAWLYVCNITYLFFVNTRFTSYLFCAVLFVFVHHF